MIVSEISDKTNNVNFLRTINLFSRDIIINSEWNDIFVILMLGISLIFNFLQFSDPDFVSTYEIEDFIYVFFREMALEYDHCGKSVYSRVARICKVREMNSNHNHTHKHKQRETSH